MTCPGIDPDLPYIQTPAMSRHLQNLIETTKQPNELIKQVHEDAAQEYNRTKKRKQQELSHRILEAELSGDRTVFKNAKKRVDNQAASVATRNRRAYLIRSFETVVRQKVDESARLSGLVRRYEIAVSKKDAELLRMSLRISKLTKHVASLASQINSNQSSIKSSSSHPPRAPWNPHEFSMESMAHSTADSGATTDPSMDHGLAHFPDLQRAEISMSEVDQGPVQNMLTTYLQRVAVTQTPTECSQPMEAGLKMDGMTWDTVHAINVGDCDINLQAQMKADAKDMFHPVA